MTHRANLLKNFAAVIFFCSLSTQVFAYAGATKGHYFQVDAVGFASSNRLGASQEYKDYRTTNFGETYDAGGKYYILYDYPNSSKVGQGFTYKYAFSAEKTLIDPLKWLFVAPAIFYENINSSGTGKTYGNVVNINNRYGFKVDVGYDFDYGISPFLVGGLSSTSYTIKMQDLDKTTKSGSDYATFYGAGIAYSPFDKFSFVLEYNEQSNIFKSHVSGDYSATGAYFDRVYSRNRIIKFGVAYHF